MTTYKPNLIIYRDIDVLNIKQIEQINLNSKLKSISILLSGFPPRNNNYYRLFSHVIFRNPCMQDSLKKYCNSSSLIYHCFNSNILKNLFLKNFDEIDKFLSFDGSSYSDGYYKHKKRYFYLNYLLKKKSISCHIHEKNNFYHYLTYVNYLIYKKSKSMIKIIKLIYTIIDKLIYLTFKKKLKRIKIILNEIENFNDEKNINFYGGPLKLIFQNSIKKPIFGIDYYKSINNSKNSLNIHTEGCGDCSGNIRLFEITGLRSCMISEKFQNMEHLFEDGKEYVSYNSIEELEEKINFLRNNPREAQIIAKNGFEKTMNYHTDKTRSEEYIDTLKKLLI